MSVREALYEAPGPRAKRISTIATIASLLLLAGLLVYVLRRFYAWGQLDKKYWSFFLRATTWSFLGKGLLGTLKAALCSAAIAFALGLLFMLGRVLGGRVLSAVCRAFTEISRGVPTLLFIYFFFLIVPQYGIKLPLILKISLPVAISAAGTVSETLRGGVNAVPKGQWEAGFVLGMSRMRVFFRIIFPQAMRTVVPALISELVIVLKDTTFAYVVNYPDLMQNARVLISNYDAMLQVYLLVAVVYILINYFLNRASEFIAGRRR